tara:strand:+ start:228 stop:584 length:357 start_codon:yes stop_codon:yes gene_type:complete
MSNIKDRFTNFLSEIEQLESDNKKLNEDILALEKEKEAGYKTFNTDTHVLVSKDTLRDIQSEVSDAVSEARYATEEAESAYSYADNAAGNAQNAQDSCDSVERRLDKILSPTEEYTEA